MNGSVLLDSTVAIDHLRNRNAQLAGHLQSGCTLFLPLTALGELYAGAERSAQPAKTHAVVSTLLQSVSVLYCDEITATHYGRIYAQLARAGTPIPQNDIWIAALAMEHNLPLATRDAHFKHVQNLALAHWLSPVKSLASCGWVPHFTRQ